MNKNLFGNAQIQATQNYIVFQKIIKNQFVQRTRVLLLNMKLKNSSQKSWIIGLCSENICDVINVSNKPLNFLWTMFSTKAIKVCHTIVIGTQSYLMCFYRFVLIRIYLVNSILHSILQFLSYINTFKFRFILKISLYIQVSQRVKRY